MSTDYRKLTKGEPQSYSSCPLYQVDQVKAKLVGLQLAACDPSINQSCFIGTSSSESVFQELYTEISESDASSFKSVLTVANSSTSCSLCSLKFQNLQEQKEHFRSDWHLYNLRQKLRGMSPVSEEVFENIVDNLSSSISGSDLESESEDNGYFPVEDMLPDVGPIGKPYSNTVTTQETPDASHCHLASNKRNYPKLFLKNNKGELISVYKCILYHKKNPPSSIKLVLEYLSKLPGAMSWAVFLASGGHFAATIFENGKVIMHKTFHRYTVRAKQGKSQGSRDGRGNAPRSAGASLRRHNESALNQDVQELLTSWSDYLMRCDLIFLRAPSFNQQMFFSGKNSPLSRNDFRIRGIPFHTRRPTHNETCRVHEMLASVECYGNESEMQEFIPRSPPRHFSTNTGQLEIITDVSQLRNNVGKLILFDKKKKNLKSKLGKKASEDNVQENTSSVTVDDRSCSETENDSDIKLHFVTEETSTCYLNPDEINFGQQAAVKSNKISMDAKPKPATKGSKEKNYIRNELYRACKTGNLHDANKLISWLAKHACVPNSKNKSESQRILTDEIAKDTKDVIESSVTPENVLDGKVSKNRTIPLENSFSEIANPSCATTTDTVVQSDNSPNNDAIDDYVKSSDKENKTGNIICDASLNLVMADDIKFPDILNEQWGRDKHTLLHAIAQNCQPEIISPLLEAGANPAICNSKGIPPYCIADKETRNEFRRFMAKFPDKYGYRKAQIPSPLTPALEAEKKQKDSMRKKVKQQRLKERRSIDKQREASIEESNLKQQQQKLEALRFKNLSEREKRALAAERRILDAKESDEEKPVFSRCSQCQCNISGLVPFEYYNFRFCTPKCLKDHRLKSKTS
ncbi:ankyrin repeat and zinc finger domain-containing protein 1 isoform X1 [Octopus bimaculoides]|nr:ankyrin repeat and zinc finger domain-containing protein 1 isoform X1 [Octopus bimaculoides]XP_052826488.1 ankyrin repeat and zinc finger domain-containing protein 1 isoform X1 [Octopus bimaculoides]XP_052826489.1 ankyrin repeat and zinc finger domain-containing protein 1 isoform X1 [Octopus bimaculoides]XP_052826490.1 ankyrin repeat and zinc finger domain-containing protein 1 isoform X1 [Octopus bimaculoides]XP_052826491.1 ankyrin repeat and zinc finger domain-containing protein 1 isoform X